MDQLCKNVVDINNYMFPVLQPNQIVITGNLAKKFEQKGLHLIKKNDLTCKNP